MKKGHFYFRNNERGVLVEGVSASDAIRDTVHIMFDDIDAIDIFMYELDRLRDKMEKANVVDQES